MVEGMVEGMVRSGRSSTGMVPAAADNIGEAMVVVVMGVVVMGVVVMGVVIEVVIGVVMVVKEK